MNYWRLIPLSSALLLAGCNFVSWTSQPPVVGSGQIITTTRNVSGFDRVSVNGSGDLTVVQGDTESLSIEADDNLVPLIQSEVSNGQLWIGTRNVSMRPSKTIRYLLKLKKLSDLDLSGALHAQADSLHSEKLMATISGAGKIRLPHLEAQSFALKVSGAGDATVAGTVNNQSLEISGSGDYSALDLASQSASIQISGAGSANVWAKQQLTVSISGSGSVKYYGQPQITPHISGAGSLKGLGPKE